jgi:predicted O-methyltransferase YrrM
MHDDESKIKILANVSPKMADFLEAMKTMGKKRNIPNISWNTAFFLREKLQSRSIENILEIGPANGFSTMMLALSCPEAQITSIECSRHAFEELRHNLISFDALQRNQSQICVPAEF